MRVCAEVSVKKKRHWPGKHGIVETILKLFKNFAPDTPSITHEENEAV